MAAVIALADRLVKNRWVCIAEQLAQGGNITFFDRLNKLQIHIAAISLNVFRSVTCNRLLTNILTRRARASKNPGNATRFEASRNQLGAILKYFSTTSTLATGMS